MANQEKPPVVVPTTMTSPSVGLEIMLFEYCWELQNSCYSPSGTSPIFVTELNQNLKWSLSYLNTTELNGRHSSQFKLRLEPSNVSKMRIKWTLLHRERRGRYGTIYSDDGTTCRHQSIHNYGPSDKICVFDATAFKSDRQSRFNTPAFIDCTIELSDYEFNISARLASIKIPNFQLIDDMKRLFRDQKLSDLTINVRGQEFKAHRSILALRSRVFEAMFEHETTEKQKNRVDVADVEPEVFQEMLRFMYTGEAPSVDKMADKLLMAADKYELERLKVICEEALRSKMTIDNAVDILILADLHNAKHLEKRAMAFISGSSNLPKILETEGFRTLSKSRSPLIAEILRATAVNLK